MSLWQKPYKTTVETVGENGNMVSLLLFYSEGSDRKLHRLFPLLIDSVCCFLWGEAVSQTESDFCSVWGNLNKVKHHRNQRKQREETPTEEIGFILNFRWESEQKNKAVSSAEYRYFRFVSISRANVAEIILKKHMNWHKPLIYQRLMLITLIAYFIVSYICIIYMWFISF